MMNRTTSPQHSFSPNESLRYETRSRRKAVVSVVATIAVAVAVTVVGGCSPATPDDGVYAADRFTGTWRLGAFTRALDSCIPSFFASSFTGSIVLTNDTTFLSVFEDQQRRDSTCTFNRSTRLATCSGSGAIAGVPITWNTRVQFTQDSTPRATVTETLRLPERNNCGATFTSEPLNKV